MATPAKTSSVSEDIELLNTLPSTDCAANTFRAIEEHLATVQESVEIHMFVWRSDEVGNTIAAALLQAAERGVAFLIRKDMGAIMYERIEMNRQPLFDIPISFARRAYYRLIRPTFPDTYCPDTRDGSLGDQLMNHPNGSLDWVDHTHSKYYIFDNKTIITGSINLEDRHRSYFDYMVKLHGQQHVERFKNRQSGSIPVDPVRSIEFVFNRFNQEHQRQFEIKPLLLELIHKAESSVYMEMAYLGDPDITAAIVQAAAKGVTVTILASREANVGNDLNYRVLNEIYEKASINLHLSKSMIHSKLTLVDDTIAFFGSANASVFSMQKAVEFNLLVQDQPIFIEHLRDLIAKRLDASQRITDGKEILSFRSWLASLQQFHQIQSR